jgi:hypothetical protein
MWSAGNDARQLYWQRFSKEPPKELRTKTGGGGSHCFAIYPDAWFDDLERIIRSQQVEKRSSWGTLNATLNFRGVVSRKVFDKVRPSVIVYVFEDESSAWRYASEPNLRSGPPIIPRA